MLPLCYILTYWEYLTFKGGGWFYHLEKGIKYEAPGGRELPRGHVSCVYEKAHSVKDLGLRVQDLMESKLEDKLSNDMKTGDTCIQGSSGIM